MLVKILVGIAVVLGALAAFIALQPAEFSVSRTATFAAPASAVYAQVNELKKWEAWSPWAKKDPQAKSSYAGPAAGTGASMSWAGNSEVGEGRMSIVESSPNALVRFKLEFFKPFAATNSADFSFKEVGGRTALTWTMRGHNGFLGKAMCLVFDMDKMVGGDFEAGLAGIKAIVEAKK
jgi:polyketide cyclase/dehydrase/lipid transport protein